MSGAYVHPTLAGVYDGSGRFDPDGARRLVGSALDGVRADHVFALGPLAAARAPSTETPDDGRTLCLLAGRVYNIDRIRSLAGLDAALGPERVIASAYRARGEEVLTWLSGAFALVLWNGEEQRGILVQDQVGARSVYYASNGARLYFASDVAPLLRMLPARPAPDEVTLVHRVANSDPPIERTAYDGVRRLCGGHLLEFAEGGWNRRRYWAPRYRTPGRTTPQELQDAYWQAVSGAVRMRMVDGDPLGIIMSGGVDSSTVAAAAMEATDGTSLPRGYSAVFPSRPDLDESDRIELLSQGIGIPSVQIEPSPGGIFPLLLEYMRRWEVPLSGPGYILERPLMEQASSDGIAVLLDGQGGDEVFGLSPYLIADRLRRGRLVSSVRLARQFPLALERPPWAWSAKLWRVFGLKPAVSHRVHRVLRSRRGRYVPRYLAPGPARTFAETETSLDWRRNRSGPLWWSFKASILAEGREQTYLSEYLRHRAAMAGIEARPPLISLELVEFALGYPPELDFDRRYDRPNIRHALAGRVPDPVRLDRRKSNIGSFYHEGWIGPDLPLLRRVLLAPDAEVQRLVRPGVIAGLLAEPPGLDAPNWGSWGPRVWSLLATECFLRFQEDPAFVDRLLASPELVRPRSRVIRAPVVVVS